MSLLRHVLRVCAVLAAIGLSGCASPPRTPEADASIRSVVVLSAIREDMPVDKIGLTVFNNKNVPIPMGPAINLQLADLVEARVRAARPAWQVRDGRSTFASLQAVVRAPTVMFESRSEKLVDQAKSIAAQLDVDAVLLILDWRGDGPYSEGIGALYRTITLRPSQSVEVRNSVLIRMLDRTGRTIGLGVRSEPGQITSPEALGLDPDLAGISTEAGQARVRAAFQAEALKTIESAAKRMGY